jgi:pyruvate/2-oxoglutarate/acetoin dehydrogenase E1 component/TPP-dependent pyruvate/acetoin dehydrogenase alpha subunit
MAKAEEREAPPPKREPRRRRRAVVTPKAKLEISPEQIVADYRLANQSRIASVIGRREVLTGKAKFGIFGDGKEVAQLAMAKAFRDGDWRSGYYRDQTFMLAGGMMNLREFFGQLYANTDLAEDPATGGRQMGSHFSSRFLDDEGNWKLPQTDQKHTAADMSPTAGHMAHTLGLGYASRLYRQNPDLKEASKGFSDNGDEVVFGTIGNASTSEGVFFETMNAAGVLGVPIVMSVWDDDYGISVPNEFQTIKSSISAALAGFRREDGTNGLDIYVVKGWDYLELCDVYQVAAEKVRKTHVPALIHVVEMTQPQGHSTSGSHERYKSKERLAWEAEHDCNRKMREWMIAEGIATAEDLDAAEAEDRKTVERERRAAWDAYMKPIQEEQKQVLSLLSAAQGEADDASDLDPIISELREPDELNRRVIQATMVRAMLALRGQDFPAKKRLSEFLEDYRKRNDDLYNSHLFSQSPETPLRIKEEKPVYSDDPEMVDGRVVLVRCFDHRFETDPRVFVVGEDVGKLGDVNLVFEGLNAKYGDLRVTDTGIREATILGQGIGAAMRGLRPIVDIQYLDYLLYALQGMSDDLATLHYRSAGGQKAPVVIRTKGHRLQGIWHTGSPMGMILNSCPGIYVCVPRDMTRAAGMYNTLFQGDNPALLIEVLSGYYLKEPVPDNVGTFTVPLGVPEVLREGNDVTLATYGACCRIAMEAADLLEDLDVDLEVIDGQTLSPFDIDHAIARSVEKTNALICVDEDVPGGASAFMLREILEVQGAWEHLDAPPRTLPASPNRSAYATDGQYFTKPNRESIVEAVYALMHDRDPSGYPL